jgi:uncharacterized damage-inducible protein DinB
MVKNRTFIFLVLMKELIDTWHINNRINLYLLDAINEEYLADIPVSKGRTVGEQFAHIHNVRLMWLKASAPALLERVEKIEKENISKALIISSLKESGDAIASLLEKAFTDGKIKSFKPHPSAFLGYLLAHEAHHRGQIMLALKQSGHKVDQKVQYGIWEWGSR